MSHPIDDRTGSSRALAGRSAVSLHAVAADPSLVIGAVTVVLFLLAFVAVPNFSRVSNLRALFLSVSLVGIAAVGLSLITIVGRLFSLSISATVAVSTVVFAATLGYGPWVAMAITVAVGVLIGVFQGSMVGKLGTDPIVTTIAVAAMEIGVAQVFTGGRNVTGTGSPGVFTATLLGIIPVQVLIFGVVTGVAWWTHRQAVVGRLTSLVGLNERAALVSGLRSWPIVLFAFTVSGALAALAGGLLASESGQGNLQLGATVGFDAITAVVVGGISVKGGVGNPLGAAVGAVLIGMLGNALVLLGLTYEVQLILKGVLVVGAVMFTGLASSLAAPRRR